MTIPIKSCEVPETPIHDHQKTGMWNYIVDAIITLTQRNEEGELLCKKCGHLVIVDWFEYSLECQGCDEL